MSASVSCLSGEALVTDPWTVRVKGESYTAKNIVLATGAGPSMPNIPGLQDMQPLTSDNLWELKELPRRLLVLGAGPIGLELAQAFRRLGSEVTLLEKNARLLANEDTEVSDAITQALERDGIRVITNAQAREFQKGDDAIMCLYTAGDGNDPAAGVLEFDRILVATGRSPRVKNLGLEELGIALTAKGAIQVNARMQTNFSNIYACGDVTSQYQFTHMAAHHAWFASMNALLALFSFAPMTALFRGAFIPIRKWRARLNEKEAKERGIARRLRCSIPPTSIALWRKSKVAELIKIITSGTSDKILGVSLSACTRENVFPNSSWR